MEITELPATPLVLPAAGELVHIRTQQWALERWEGEDPPGLAVPWGRKPKFSVNGSRSCAELAIVHHLQAGGWNGVWVNAFGGELRTQWFPAPAARQLAEVGAPEWAVETFGLLRAANGGTLSGFFDVFAWREPGASPARPRSSRPRSGRTGSNRLSSGSWSSHCASAGWKIS